VIEHCNNDEKRDVDCNQKVQFIVSIMYKVDELNYGFIVYRSRVSVYYSSYCYSKFFVTQNFTTHKILEILLSLLVCRI